jgi:hypothetical protein
MPKEYLSRAEEQILGKLAFGNQERFDLVRYNQRFMVFWCLSYFNRNRLVSNLEPLLIAAEDAMIDCALNRFKATPTATRFITYTSFYMKRACNAAVHSELCVVKLPPLRKENEHLLREDVMYEHPLEVLDHYHHNDVETREQLMISNRWLASRQEPTEPEQMVELGELAVDLRTEVRRKITNPIHRRIFMLRWGMEGNEPLNNGDIAEKFGYTREGIRRIIDRCKQKLSRSILLKEHRKTCHKSLLSSSA